MNNYKILARKQERKTLRITRMISDGTKETLVNDITD